MLSIFLYLNYPGKSQGSFSEVCNILCIPLGFENYSHSLGSHHKWMVHTAWRSYWRNNGWRGHGRAPLSFENDKSGGFLVSWSMFSDIPRKTWSCFGFLHSRCSWTLHTAGWLYCSKSAECRHYTSLLQFATDKLLWANKKNRIKNIKSQICVSALNRTARFAQFHNFGTAQCYLYL